MLVIANGYYAEPMSLFGSQSLEDMDTFGTSFSNPYAFGVWFKAANGMFKVFRVWLTTANGMFKAFGVWFKAANNMGKVFGIWFTAANGMFKAFGVASLTIVLLLKSITNLQQLVIAGTTVSNN